MIDTFLHNSVNINSWVFIATYAGGTIHYHILQIRKLMHRNVKELVQDYRASEDQNKKLS